MLFLTKCHIGLRVSVPLVLRRIGPTERECWGARQALASGDTSSVPLVRWGVVQGRPTLLSGLALWVEAGGALRLDGPWCIRRPLDVEGAVDDEVVRGLVERAPWLSEPERIIAAAEAAPLIERCPAALRAFSRPGDARSIDAVRRALMVESSSRQLRYVRGALTRARTHTSQAAPLPEETRLSLAIRQGILSGELPPRQAWRLAQRPADVAAAAARLIGAGRGQLSRALRRSSACAA